MLISPTVIGRKRTYWIIEIMVRKGQQMRTALTHPFGLTVLTTSLLVAAAMRYLPPLERWDGQATWVALWGFLGYGISAYAVTRWQPAPSGAELVTLQSIRQYIEGELALRQESHSTELTRTLSEAISYIDRQVEPLLAHLMERESDLATLLEQYERGTLPPPEQSVLARLQRLHQLQRDAIDDCLQQAANAAGTLAAILQTGDDTRVAA
ncbi:MAG: hypothetical protein QF898_03445, partial [SAR202 cluster bacterium]|nr:hypothetical protein [SAR202 cluster bacterium]